MVVPCWDDPGFRSNFTLKLTVPATKTALSNMSIASTVYHEDKTKTYKFCQTPKMSSYLLAFAIGSFEYIELFSSSRIKTRVYTGVSRRHLVNFAADVAVKALDFYEDYFGIPYPLPKCDLLAVPDLTFAAMENWGLLTFRCESIYYDFHQSSISTKEVVALTVAHELAHMWFGNLVTMEWWTYLWLNEGFATFMEYLCIDSIFPKWAIFDGFVHNLRNSALTLDCLKSSHPIEVPVSHPSEIYALFDNITYGKGSALIRMVHQWLGDQCFSKAIKSYLVKFSYKNTVSNNLWEEMEMVSGIPLLDAMTSWTNESGYPLLSVEVCDWKNNNLTIIVTKHKFNYGMTNEQSDRIVPIFTRTSAQQKVESIVLNQIVTKLTFQNVCCKTGWINLNADGIGLYRVQYPTVLLQRLYTNIQYLSDGDCIDVQSNQVALVRMGLESATTFLKVKLFLNLLSFTYTF